METEEKKYHVITVPLYTSPYAAKVLESRFEIGRLLYNSFLSECLKRRSNKKCSKDYLLAVKIYREIDFIKGKIDKFKSLKDKSLKPKIKKLKKVISFLELRKKALFTKAKIDSGFYVQSGQGREIISLEQYASSITTGTWLEDHIDSHTRNKLMERAFKTVEELDNSKKKSKKKITKAKYKRRGQDFLTSLEGKTMTSCIIIKEINGRLHFSWCHSRNKKFKNLVMPLLCYDEDGQINDLKWQPLLDVSNFKYVRILRKKVKNKWQHFVQLICKGNAPQKSRDLGVGSIGMDLGPTLLAYVSDKQSELRQLGFNVVTSKTFFQLIRDKRNIQRQLDRQRRANNPKNFDKKGQIVPRQQRVQWYTSKRQEKLQSKLKNLERRVAEFRKQHYNELAWEIRSQGDVVYLDNDSFKPWQKNYGKSIGNNAPGLFVSILENVFFSTGGAVFKLNTFKTKSSQRCPNCNSLKKKGLAEGVDNRSVRIHQCDCGFFMQRDITSAIVNKFTNPETCDFDADKSSQFIQEKRPLLVGGIEKLLRSAKEGYSIPGSLGTVTELEQIVNNDAKLPDDS